MISFRYQHMLMVTIINPPTSKKEQKMCRQHIYAKVSKLLVNSFCSEMLFHIDFGEYTYLSRDERRCRTDEELETVPRDDFRKYDMHNYIMNK